MTDQCKHRAYSLKDGQLVCQQCGEPSPSVRWKANVYGQQTQAAKRAPSRKKGA